MVELITRRQMIPTKSCQSGGRPSPLAKAMAMMAAASMTHESGFHINPKNLRILLSFFSSSLFGPKIWILSSPSCVVKPSLVHFSCWNTSSIGIFSCEIQIIANFDQITNLHTRVRFLILKLRLAAS